MGEAKRRRTGDANHFGEWTPGRRVHAHLGTCIICGAGAGDTVIFARLDSTAGQLSFQLESVGSRLCPSCRANHLPLTEPMNEKLKRLGDKVWADLKKRGCPCCTAGLNWYPTEQAH